MICSRFPRIVSLPGRRRRRADSGIGPGRRRGWKGRRPVRRHSRCARWRSRSPRRRRHYDAGAATRHLFAIPTPSVITVGRPAASASTAASPKLSDATVRRTRRRLPSRQPWRSGREILSRRPQRKRRACQRGREDREHSNRRRSPPPLIPPGGSSSGGSQMRPGEVRLPLRDLAWPKRERSAGYRWKDNAPGKARVRAGGSRSTGLGITTPSRADIPLRFPDAPSRCRTGRPPRHGVPRFRSAVWTAA
jgi:hypothetical protein